LALKVNYLKNIIKSVAFTAADVADDIAPNVTGFANASKDLAKMTYSKIRLPNASSRRRMAGFLNSLIFKPMDNAWQNIKSDLKTGDFYAKEREEQAAMDSMDGGFNFDDLEDFDMDAGKEAATDALLASKTFSAGDVAITRSIEGSIASSTQSTISSILASTENNIRNTRANAAMAFEQRERIFGVTHNDLQTTNNVLQSIFELQKKVNINIDKNLSIYQTEQLKLSTQTNELLKEILENQKTMMPKTADDLEKSKAEKEAGYRAARFTDLTSGGVPDVNKLVDFVKTNFVNNMGLLSIIDPQMLQQTINQLAASPIKTGVKYLMKSAIPASSKRALEDLNNTAGGIFANLIQKAIKAGDSGSTLGGIISSLFGVNTNYNDKLDTSKYEKGAISFDGITRKAITNVIPGYLRRIESFLTGRKEIDYDYDRGTWINLSDMRQQHANYEKMQIEDVTRELMEAMSDELLKAQGKLREEMGESVEEFRKAQEEFRTYLFRKNGQFKVNEDELNEFGDIDIDEDLPMLRKYIRLIKDVYDTFDQEYTKDGKTRYTSSGLKMNLPAQIMAMKDEMENFYRQLEANSTSSLSKIFENANIGIDNYVKRAISVPQEIQESLLTNNNLDKIYNINETKSKQELVREKEIRKKVLNKINSGKILDLRDFEGVDGSLMWSDTVKNYLLELSILNSEELKEKYIKETGNKNQDFNKEEFDKFFDKQFKKAGIKNNAQFQRALENVERGAARHTYDALGQTQKTRMQQVLDKAGIGKIVNPMMGELTNKIDSTLYTADRWLYNVFFKKEFKMPNANYKGFIDFLVGEAKNAFNTFTDFISKKVIDPLKKKLGIDEGFKRRFKDSFISGAKRVGHTVGNALDRVVISPMAGVMMGNQTLRGVLRNINDDYYNAQISRMSQEQFKNKLTEEERKAYIARAKKIGKDKNSIANRVYSMGFRGNSSRKISLLKDYGLDESMIMQALANAKDEDERIAILNSLYHNEDLRRHHAAGSIIGSRPFSGRTFLSKGELLFGQGGIKEVGKTGLYDIHTPTHIMSAQDSYDFSRATGLPHHAGRTPVASALMDEKRVEKQMGLHHAKGTMPKGMDQNTISMGIKAFKANAPEVLGTAAVGGLTYGALGLIGGPLIGASLAAGAHLISKSEGLQNMLFGKTDEKGKYHKGLISKGVQDTVKKYASDMVDYGIIGALSGLILPFGPLGGLMMGGALGFLKQNKSFRDRLLGQVDYNSPDFKKTLKKLLPRALVGGILGKLFLGGSMTAAGASIGSFVPLVGGLFGPLGMLGSIAIGSVLAMATGTEEFHKMLFGTDIGNGEKVGGMLNVIKDAFKPLKEAGIEFKDNIKHMMEDKVIKPLSDFLAPTLHALPRLAASIPKKINKVIEKGFGVGADTIVERYIANPIKSVFKGIAKHPFLTSSGLGILGMILGSLGLPTLGLGMFAGAPGVAVKAGLAGLGLKMAGGIGNKLRRKQLKNLDAAYMGTGAERLAWRTAHGDKVDPKKDIDTYMANISGREAANMSKNIEKILDSRDNLNKQRKRKNQEILNKIKKFRTPKGNKVSAKAIMAIGKAINEDRLNEIPSILTNIPLEGSDRGMTREQLNELMSNKFGGLANNIAQFTDLNRRYEAANNYTDKDRFAARSQLKSMFKGTALEGVDLKDTEMLQKLKTYYDIEANAKLKVDGQPMTQMEMTAESTREIKNIRRLLEELVEITEDYEDGGTRRTKRAFKRDYNEITGATKNELAALRREGKRNLKSLPRWMRKRLSAEDLANLESRTRNTSLLYRGLGGTADLITGTAGLIGHGALGLAGMPLNLISKGLLGYDFKDTRTWERLHGGIDLLERGANFLGHDIIDTGKDVAHLGSELAHIGSLGMLDVGAKARRRDRMTEDVKKKYDVMKLNKKIKFDREASDRLADVNDTLFERIYDTLDMPYISRFLSKKKLTKEDVDFLHELSEQDRIGLDNILSVALHNGQARRYKTLKDVYDDYKNPKNNPALFSHRYASGTLYNIKIPHHAEGSPDARKTKFNNATKNTKFGTLLGAALGHIFLGPLLNPMAGFAGDFLGNIFGGLPLIGGIAAPLASLLLSTIGSTATGAGIGAMIGHRKGTKTLKEVGEDFKEHASKNIVSVIKSTIAASMFPVLKSVFTIDKTLMQTGLDFTNIMHYGMLGAATSLVVKSKWFNKLFFGDLKREDVKKNPVKTVIGSKLMRGLGTGVLTSLLGLSPFGIFGSSLVGVAGTLGSFISKTKWFNNFFFGESDKATSEKHRRWTKWLAGATAALTAAGAVGAGLAGYGSIASNLGSVSGLMLTAAGGFISSTNLFNKLLFGTETKRGNRKGGLINFIRKTLTPKINNSRFIRYTPEILEQSTEVSEKSTLNNLIDKRAIENFNKTQADIKQQRQSRSGKIKAITSRIPGINNLPPGYTSMMLPTMMPYVKQLISYLPGGSIANALLTPMYAKSSMFVKAGGLLSKAAGLGLGGLPFGGFLADMAGFGLLSKNKLITDTIFGGSDYDPTSKNPMHHITKRIIPKFIRGVYAAKLSAPVSAAISAGVSLIPGVGPVLGPILGAAISGGIGIAASSDKVSEMIAGKVGMDGERHGGLIDAIRDRTINPITEATQTLVQGIKNTWSYTKNKVTKSKLWQKWVEPYTDEETILKNQYKQYTTKYTTDWFTSLLDGNFSWYKKKFENFSKAMYNMGDTSRKTFDKIYTKAEEFYNKMPETVKTAISNLGKVIRKTFTKIFSKPIGWLAGGISKLFSGKINKKLIFNPLKGILNLASRGINTGWQYLTNDSEEDRNKYIGKTIFEKQVINNEDGLDAVEALKRLRAGARWSEGYYRGTKEDIALQVLNEYKKNPSKYTDTGPGSDFETMVNGFGMSLEDAQKLVKHDKEYLESISSRQKLAKAAIGNTTEINKLEEARSKLIEFDKRKKESLEELSTEVSNFSKLLTKNGELKKSDKFTEARQIRLNNILDELRDSKNFDQNPARVTQLQSDLITLMNELDPDNSVLNTRIIKSDIGKIVSANRKFNNYDKFDKETVKRIVGTEMAELIDDTIHGDYSSENMDKIMRSLDTNINKGIENANKVELLLSKSNDHLIDITSILRGIRQDANMRAEDSLNFTHSVMDMYQQLYGAPEIKKTKEFNEKTNRANINNATSAMRAIANGSLDLSVYFPGKNPREILAELTKQVTSLEQKKTGRSNVSNIQSDLGSELLKTLTDNSVVGAGVNPRVQANSAIAQAFGDIDKQIELIAGKRAYEFRNPAKLSRYIRNISGHVGADSAKVIKDEILNLTPESEIFSKYLEEQNAITRNNSLINHYKNKLGISDTDLDKAKQVKIEIFNKLFNQLDEIRFLKPDSNEYGFTDEDYKRYLKLYERFDREIEKTYNTLESSFSSSTGRAPTEGERSTLYELTNLILDNIKREKSQENEMYKILKSKQDELEGYLDENGLNNAETEEFVEKLPDIIKNTLQHFKSFNEEKYDITNLENQFKSIFENRFKQIDVDIYGSNKSPFSNDFTKYMEEYINARMYQITKDKRYLKNTDLTSLPDEWKNIFNRIGLDLTNLDNYSEDLKTQVKKENAQITKDLKRVPNLLSENIKKLTSFEDAKNLIKSENIPITNDELLSHWTRIKTNYDQKTLQSNYKDKFSQKEFDKLRLLPQENPEVRLLRSIDLTTKAIFKSLEPNINLPNIVNDPGQQVVDRYLRYLKVDKDNRISFKKNLKDRIDSLGGDSRDRNLNRIIESLFNNDTKIQSEEDILRLMGITTSGPLTDEQKELIKFYKNYKAEITDIYNGRKPGDEFKKVSEVIQWADEQRSNKEKQKQQNSIRKKIYDLIKDIPSLSDKVVTKARKDFFNVDNEDSDSLLRLIPQNVLSTLIRLAETSMNNLSSSMTESQRKEAENKIHAILQGHGFVTSKESENYDDRQRNLVEQILQRLITYSDIIKPALYMSESDERRQKYYKASIAKSKGQEFITGNNGNRIGVNNILKSSYFDADADPLTKMIRDEWAILSRDPNIGTVNIPGGGTRKLDITKPEDFALAVLNLENQEKQKLINKRDKDFIKYLDDVGRDLKKESNKKSASTVQADTESYNSRLNKIKDLLTQDPRIAKNIGIDISTEFTNPQYNYNTDHKTAENALKTLQDKVKKSRYYQESNPLLGLPGLVNTQFNNLIDETRYIDQDRTYNISTLDSSLNIGFSKIDATNNLLTSGNTVREEIRDILKSMKITVEDIKNSSGNSKRKLNDTQVNEIRSLYASGKSIKQLASTYGVSRSTISNVVHHKGAYTNAQGTLYNIPIPHNAKGSILRTQIYQPTGEIGSYVVREFIFGFKNLFRLFKDVGTNFGYWLEHVKRYGLFGGNLTGAIIDTAEYFKTKFPILVDNIKSVAEDVKTAVTKYIPDFIKELIDITKKIGIGLWDWTKDIFGIPAKFIYGLAKRFPKTTMLAGAGIAGYLARNLITSPAFLSALGTAVTTVAPYMHAISLAYLGYKALDKFGGAGNIKWGNVLNPLKLISGIANYGRKELVNRFQYADKSSEEQEEMLERNAFLKDGRWKKGLTEERRQMLEFGKESANAKHMEETESMMSGLEKVIDKTTNGKKKRDQLKSELMNKLKKIKGLRLKDGMREGYTLIRKFENAIENPIYWRQDYYEVSDPRHYYAGPLTDEEFKIIQGQLEDIILSESGDIDQFRELMNSTGQELFESQNIDFDKLFEGVSDENKEMLKKLGITDPDMAKSVLKQLRTDYKIGANSPKAQTEELKNLRHVTEEQNQKLDDQTTELKNIANTGNEIKNSINTLTTRLTGEPVEETDNNARGTLYKIIPHNGIGSFLSGAWNWLTGSDNDTHQTEQLQLGTEKNPIKSLKQLKGIVGDTKAFESLSGSETDKKNDGRTPVQTKYGVMYYKKKSDGSVEPDTSDNETKRILKLLEEEARENSLLRKASIAAMGFGDKLGSAANGIVKKISKNGTLNTLIGLGNNLMKLFIGGKIFKYMWDNDVFSKLWDRLVVPGVKYIWNEGVPILKNILSTAWDEYIWPGIKSLPGLIWDGFKGIGKWLYNTITGNYNEAYKDKSPEQIEHEGFNNPRTENEKTAFKDKDGNILTQKQVDEKYRIAKDKAAFSGEEVDTGVYNTEGIQGKANVQGKVNYATGHKATDARNSALLSQGAHVVTDIHDTILVAKGLKFISKLTYNITTFLLKVGTLGILSGPIKCIESIFNKSYTIIVGLISKGFGKYFERISSKIMETSIAQNIANWIPYISIAIKVNDFAYGVSNAAAMLGIEDPSPIEQFVCGITNLVCKILLLDVFGSAFFANGNVIGDIARFILTEFGNDKYKKDFEKKSEWSKKIQEASEKYEGKTWTYDKRLAFETGGYSRFLNNISVLWNKGYEAFVAQYEIDGQAFAKRFDWLFTKELTDEEFLKKYLAYKNPTNAKILQSVIKQGSAPALELYIRLSLLSNMDIFTQMPLDRDAGVQFQNRYYKRLLKLYNEYQQNENKLKTDFHDFELISNNIDRSLDPNELLTIKEKTARISKLLENKFIHSEKTNDNDFKRQIDSEDAKSKARYLLNDLTAVMRNDESSGKQIEDLYRYAIKYNKNMITGEEITEDQLNVFKNLYYAYVLRKKVDDNNDNDVKTVVSELLDSIYKKLPENDRGSYDKDNDLEQILSVYKDATKVSQQKIDEIIIQKYRDLNQFVKANYDKIIKDIQDGRPLSEEIIETIFGQGKQLFGRANIQLPSGMIDTNNIDQRMTASQLVLPRYGMAGTDTGYRDPQIGRTYNTRDLHNYVNYPIYNYTIPSTIPSTLPLSTDQRFTDNGISVLSPEAVESNQTIKENIENTTSNGVAIIPPELLPLDYKKKLDESIENAKIDLIAKGRGLTGALETDSLLIKEAAIRDLAKVIEENNLLQKQQVTGEVTTPKPYQTKYNNDRDENDSKKDDKKDKDKKKDKEENKDNTLLATLMDKFGLNDLQQKFNDTITAKLTTALEESKSDIDTKKDKTKFAGANHIMDNNTGYLDIEKSINQAQKDIEGKEIYANDAELIREADVDRLNAINNAGWTINCNVDKNSGNYTETWSCKLENNGEKLWTAIYLNNGNIYLIKKVIEEGSTKYETTIGKIAWGTEFNFNISIGEDNTITRTENTAGINRIKQKQEKINANPLALKAKENESGADIIQNYDIRKIEHEEAILSEKDPEKQAELAKEFQRIEMEEIRNNPTANMDRNTAEYRNKLIGRDKVLQNPVEEEIDKNIEIQTGILNYAKNRAVNILSTSAEGWNWMALEAAQQVDKYLKSKGIDVGVEINNIKNSDIATKLVEWSEAVNNITFEDIKQGAQDLIETGLNKTVEVANDVKNWDFYRFARNAGKFGNYLWNGDLDKAGSGLYRETVRFTGIDPASVLAETYNNYGAPIVNRGIEFYNNATNYDYEQGLANLKDTVTDKAKEWYGNAEQRVTGFNNDYVQPFYQAVKNQDYEGMAEATVNKTDELYNAGKNYAIKGITNVSNGIKNAVAPITNPFMEGWNQADRVAEKNRTALINKGIDKYKKLKGDAIALAKSAYSYTGQKLEIAGDFISGIYSPVGEYIGEVYDANHEPIEAFFDSAYHEICQQIDSAGRWVGKIYDASGKEIKKIYDSTGNVIGECVDNAIEFGKEQVNNVRTMTGLGKFNLFGRGYTKQIDPRVANIGYNVKGDTEVQTIGDSGCGPAAVTNVLEYYGKYGRGINNLIDAASSMRGHKEINGGTPPNTMMDYLSKHGVMSSVTRNKGDINRAINSNTPTILQGVDTNGVSRDHPFGSTRHYVVKTGEDRFGRAIVQDPESPYQNLIYDKNQLAKHTEMAISTGMGKYGKGKEENAKYIRDFFINNGATENGAYGILGNIETESAHTFSPERTEHLLLSEMRKSGKDFGFPLTGNMAKDSHAYTEAIDKGLIDKQEFLYPSVGKDAGRDRRGYGLIQYTSAGRKAKLWQNTKESGKSIGDLQGQLNTILGELKTSYKAVWKVLTDSSKSIEEAAQIFCKKFEVPANKEQEALKRAQNALEWKSKLTGMPIESNPVSPSQEIDSNGNPVSTSTNYNNSSNDGNSTEEKRTINSPMDAINMIIEKITKAFTDELNKLFGISTPSKGAAQSTNNQSVPPTTQNPGEVPAGVSQTPYGDNTGIILDVKDIIGNAGGTITSPYGPRTHPTTGEKNKLHKGVDLIPTGVAREKRYGYPVKIAADGVVTRIQNLKNGYGNNVIVDHGNGYQTLYAHLNDTAGITNGMKVRAGQALLHMGNSGIGTGAHTHFEVRKNGTQIDPVTGLPEMAKVLTVSGTKTDTNKSAPTANAKMTDQDQSLEAAISGKGIREQKLTPRYGKGSFDFGNILGMLGNKGNNPISGIINPSSNGMDFSGLMNNMLGMFNPQKPSQYQIPKFDANNAQSMIAFTNNALNNSPDINKISLSNSNNIADAVNTMNTNISKATVDNTTVPQQQTQNTSQIPVGDEFYDKYVKPIIMVLTEVAKNTDKLNIIVSILQDRLGVELNAKELSNASFNTEHVVDKLSKAMQTTYGKGKDSRKIPQKNPYVDIENNSNEVQNMVNRINAPKEQGIQGLMNILNGIASE